MTIGSENFPAAYNIIKVMNIVKLMVKKRKNIYMKVNKINDNLQNGF